MFQDFTLEFRISKWAEFGELYFSFLGYSERTIFYLEISRYLFRCVD
jgi:hypothetical protein